MNNQQNISEKFRNLRIDRVNSWIPRLNESDYDFLFPIEREFLNRIDNSLIKNNIEFFTPLKYTYDQDKHYHIYISYLIESLDVLPLKIDLSFDFSWKGLELYMGQAYLKHKGQTISNVTDLIKYSNQHYWKTTLNTSPVLTDQFVRLLNLMPSQSYKYIGKRALENYSPTNPKANALYTRIAMKNGNVIIKIDDLLKHLYAKYGNLSAGGNTRKVGRIFFKLLKGESICLPDPSNSTNTNPFTLDLNERIDLIINGLLYTYRNERFHGNTFSPFKSSKASLQTYSHAHYLFLWSYFLVNLTKVYLGNTSISINDIEENNESNLASFKSLYGRHLRR